MPDKKLIIAALLILGAFGLRAQQRLQHSQYLLNGYLVNPAVGGAESYLDLKAGFAQQWVGFDGAPRGLYLSANKGLYEARETVEYSLATSLPVRGRRPYRPTRTTGTATPEEETRNFHTGVGGVIFSEQAGPISLNGVSGSFSGHLYLGPGIRLSLGAAMELMNYRLDPSGIDLVNDNDIAIGGSTVSLFLPGLNAGAALYGPRFFVTAATRQLLKSRIQLNPQNPVISGLEVHYIAQAGYRFGDPGALSFLPSVAVRYIGPAPPSLDLSLRASLRDALFAGLSYRHRDAVVGIIGFNFNHFLGLQYSYDFTTSNLRSFSSGTHSIVLFTRLMKGPGEGRKYFW